MKMNRLNIGVMVVALTFTNALLEAQPATAPATAQARGRGRGGPPATPEDVAEIAKLMTLPTWAINLGDGDYSIGPAYPAPPEATPRDNVPKGKVVRYTMNSAESKFYVGLGGPFERAVAVYVPAQYVAGTPLPFIVSCDQYRLENNLLPNILDNMIADKRLPVMGAIMVANGGTPSGQRRHEYDTVSGKYAQFVEAEILPRAEKEAGVTFTKDPDARMTLGGSSGGICAFTMAWFHPELYRRVLSYSGTFVNLENGPDAPHGGWEYHENFIAKNPAKPIRVWLHVGENDNGANTAFSGMRNWVIANKRMAEQLKAKGYHYQFVYAKASGHTPGNLIANTLPAALEYVWRGYPIAGK